MLSIFSLPCCPRCDVLKKYLSKKGIVVQHLEMDSAEGITELRMIGCFTMEAPVLINDDLFLESATMFPDGTLDVKLIDSFVGGV